MRVPEVNQLGVDIQADLASTVDGIRNEIVDPVRQLQGNIVAAGILHWRPV